MNNGTKTLTRGNVIVEDIKVGDIHYEYEYNMEAKCEVITKPSKDVDGIWRWDSKNLKTGEMIKYAVNPNFPPDYSFNLYTYPAYKGCTRV